MPQTHNEALSKVEQLERELDEAHHQRTLSQQKQDTAGADRDEIIRLQSALNDQKVKYEASQDAADRLRQEVESLLNALKDMNTRQDQLVNERQNEQERYDELQKEVKEWKKRYETAKTQLRNMKGEVKTQPSMAWHEPAAPSLARPLTDLRRSHESTIRPIV